MTRKERSDGWDGTALHCTALHCSDLGDSVFTIVQLSYSIVIVVVVVVGLLVI